MRASDGYDNDDHKNEAVTGVNYDGLAPSAKKGNDTSSTLDKEVAKILQIDQYNADDDDHDKYSNNERR